MSSNASGAVDLRLRQVGKRYRLPVPDAPGRRRWGRRHARDFWALRDVSFEVRAGETLGIVGPNGAGKSTLFKLLAGITAPTTGEIQVRGRLAAMIEVGSGFHPELTGRENVYLSGAILGMRRAEITAKLPQIVEFAGIGEFIDTPTKWYSSGMYVRLGFAVSAHVDPDILLVDEVLAVGDEAYQERCFDRIHTLRQAGTTIVLISHDLSAVERLCQRALLLQSGSDRRRRAAVGDRQKAPAVGGRGEHFVSGGRQQRVGRRHHRRRMRRPVRTPSRRQPHRRSIDAPPRLRRRRTR